MSMKLLMLRSPCVWRCAGVWRRAFFSGGKGEKDERKKKIWAEIDKGYFADLHEFRRNRGKRAEAPDHLCSIGESVMFPTVSGSSLSGQSLSLPPRGSSLSGQSLPSHDLVSLILVSMRGLGMSMCEQYRAPFEREFAGKQSVAVYEMSLLDKAIFRLIRGWVERNLRKKIELRRQSSFLVCSEGVESVKSGLNIGNTIVGYAYLLDKEGRVRWRAHASPNEREIKALIKCTKTLMNNSKNTPSR